MNQVRKLLVCNRIAIVSSNRLLQTSAYRYQQQQELRSPDQSRYSGPKDESPLSTGPTHEKPMTEGHAINKAKDALGAMKNTAANVTEKVKDVFTRISVPKTLDVQSDAVSKGLKDQAQQTKEKSQESWGSVKENLENAKDKSYYIAESIGKGIMKDVQSMKEKGQETIETVKKKSQDLAHSVTGVDSSRESREKSSQELANPDPIDRHPKGPVQEIKQTVTDVADSTKQQSSESSDRR